MLSRLRDPTKEKIRYSKFYVDTCQSPQASFARNESLECGHFFPIPSAVKNLLKVDSHLISRPFRHCLKVRKKNPEYKDLKILER